ncbi:transposable element P transposase [Tribolium castaneum]|nr:PREDICTED: uncharacterized protein LOC103314243 [Tribolium castaneum]XP_015840038.1 PREDICTED: uncharacterized protein LOC103314243 [Tribolium castaneum]|eukprot:XP_008197923.1 PREDICTED: uncharacterized protein LOC103314243 [Tribolium castaneum]
MKKDLTFTQNGECKTAKWKHIEQLYAIDNCEETRLGPKLADGHIFEKKMNKMKVSTMAQVFSHTVGSLIKRLSKWDTKTAYNVDAEGVHTGDFILFIDELFDSLNSNNAHAPSNKPLKSGFRRNSPHEEFWRNAIKVLETVRWYNLEKGINVKIPSIINLIKTLKGFIEIKRRLTARVSYVLSREINQDCLENFFASLRGHGRFNKSPDVAHFVSSFKALLVNNFFSRHSPRANCEEDFSTGVLGTLRCFLTGEEIAGISSLENEDLAIPSAEGNTQLHQQKSRVAKATIAYVAGYVAKKILQNYGQCEECVKMLTHSDGDVPMAVIEARQYRLSTLTKPGSYLYFVTSECVSRLLFYIPRICYKQFISVLLRELINSELDFNVLNCNIHPTLGNSVVEFQIRVMLFYWAKQINLILKGNRNEFLKNKTLRATDPIKVHAHNMYLKRKKQNI